MRNSVLLSIIFSFALSSCAIWPTTAKYEAKLKSWVGNDINNLINSWGPPSDVYTKPNGDKMYTWLYVSNTKVTTRYNEYLNQLESTASNKWCKTTFTADKGGKITYWHWKGNACRSSD